MSVDELDGLAPIHTDLLVVGAGAKGTAIAMKVHVLNRLGLGPIAMTLVEATAPAAAWMDGNGVTSSREVLAISPAKDVGFPYLGQLAYGDAGADVDAAALAFSWQRYLVELGRYARWVDAGAPPVQRRVYGAYLAWVLERAREGVEQVRGRVARVSLPARGERWLVDVAGEHGPIRYSCAAFVLTGPGVHRTISHEVDVASRVLDCDSGRMQIARAPVEQSSDIAVVGGGESALSCVEFVRAVRPDAQLTVYTPGLPMSRVESFLENRAFSNPDSVAWTSLSLQTRREFIARGDRGVFGPERVAALAYDERCSFTVGRVVHVARAADGNGVLVEHEGINGTTRTRHDYLINGTGFDLLEQLRTLLPADTRAEVERRSRQRWDGPEAHELRMGRFLELEGLRPLLQVPGLAALSQGPGFANLGSQGLIADRVLECQVGDRALDGAARPQARASAPAAQRRSAPTLRPRGA